MMDSDLLAGFMLDEWQVLPQSGELIGPGGTLHVQPKPMEVLVYLAARVGAVVERDQILCDVWDRQVFSDEPLTRCIAELRQTLGDSRQSPRFIQTIPKRGYRLIAAVKVANPDRGSSATTGGRRFLRSSLVVAGMLVLVVWLLPVSFRDRSPSIVEKARPPKHSIAVLPFLNIGKDPDSGYFADGLAEELMNAMAQHKNLLVASRTASFFFKGKDIGLDTIASRLGVANVLEGSVRRDGPRIRVSAQLIDTQSGFHLWSETYERESKEIFTVQDDIVRQVMKSLRPKLALDLNSTQSRHPNVEAFHFYLRGRDYLRRPKTNANLTSAETLFTRAVNADNRYASAYAGLCDTNLAWYGLKKESVYFERAEKSCYRALTLDENIAEVYVSLGSLYRTSGQFDKAIDEFHRAIALNMQIIEAYDGLGRSYSENGQPQAAQQAFKQAIAMQPGYWAPYKSLGNFYYRGDRFADAIQQYQKVIELNPESTTGHNNIAAAYFMVDDFEKAAQQWQQVLTLAPSFYAHEGIAIASYYLGEYATAVSHYRSALRLSPKRFETWGRMGAAYQQLPGQQKTARESYEQAKSLARKKLKINPDDWETIAYLGLYCARTGEPKRALENLSQALQHAKQKLAGIHYTAALVYIALEQPKNAYGEINEALDRGFSRRMILADPNLRSLYLASENGRRFADTLSNDKR